MATLTQQNGKHPGGRPSKYKLAYCQQLIEFMKAGGGVVTKSVVVSLGDKQGSEIIDHPLGKLPAFFEGFATSIGVTTVTLLEWCKRHAEFSSAYKIAKQIQLEQMVAGGMAGTYQQAALIFALKNMHGWRDTEDQRTPMANQPQPKFIFHIGTEKREVDTAELLSNGNGRGNGL